MYHQVSVAAPESRIRRAAAGAAKRSMFYSLYTYIHTHVYSWGNVCMAILSQNTHIYSVAIHMQSTTHWGNIWNCYDMLAADSPHSSTLDKKQKLRCEIIFVYLRSLHKNFMCTIIDSMCSCIVVWYPFFWLEQRLSMDGIQLMWLILFLVFLQCLINKY